MRLSRATQAEVQIIIPAEASLREQFAAEELKKYVQQICDAELNITTKAGKKSIFIGSPDRNMYVAQFLSQQEFDRICPGPEGMLIQSYGEDALVLAGSRGDYERGTIYAVYELLERFCGASLAVSYTHLSDIITIRKRCKSFATFTAKPLHLNKVKEPRMNWRLKLLTLFSTHYIRQSFVEGDE